MGIKVAKFGGSSVADGIQLTKTKQIIDVYKRQGFSVYAAMSVSDSERIQLHFCGQRFGNDIYAADCPAAGRTPGR